MHPVFIEIFGRTIYWYGVFVAVGFLAAVAIWNWMSRRAGHPPGFGSEIGFWIMLSGILGARLGYVLAHFDFYIENPLDIIRYDKGGLIYYGGFIGGAVGLYIFSRVRKMSYIDAIDLGATGLSIGHAFGRVGCFMNGCCFGTVHDGWPSVCFPAGSPISHHHAEKGLLDVASLPSLPVHPTQLYEAGANFALCAILVWLFVRRRHYGVVMAAYFILYPITRFLLEFQRGDARMMWGGLTIAQGISIALLLVGLVTLFTLKRRPITPHASG